MQIITDEIELLKPNTPVKLNEMRSLLKKVPNMIKAMHDNGGIGLASVQVGIHKTFFLATVRDDVKLFINPTILSYSEETEMDEEGCLSYPGIHANIERSLSIRMKYFNWHTNKFVIDTYHGFDARVIQHEYDHLIGECKVKTLGKKDGVENAG